MKKSFCVFVFTVFLSTSAYAQSETERGVELFRNNNFDEAVSVLKKVIEIDKDDRKAWTYLGASLVKQEKRSEATKAYRKASSIKLSKDALTQSNDGLLIKEKPRPSYTESARQNQTQGDIKFAVEFGGDGKIKYVYIIQGLPNGLTENAVEALKKIKFETAQKNGKTVSVVAIIEYSFRIY